MPSQLHKHVSDYWGTFKCLMDIKVNNSFATVIPTYFLNLHFAASGKFNFILTSSDENNLEDS